MTKYWEKLRVCVCVCVCVGMDHVPGSGAVNSPLRPMESIQSNPIPAEFILLETEVMETQGPGTAKSILEDAQYQPSRFMPCVH